MSERINLHLNRDRFHPIVAANLISSLIRTILIAGLTFGSSRGAEAAWRLVWSDEFIGSSVNASHWGFDIGKGGNGQLQYYTSRPENVFVSHGLLHIVARRESYHNFHYTSANLKTRDRFCQKYGRFEFRARLPKGKGYWPAFWLMPEHAVYGGWAASGEIDVMENKGDHPGNVLGTIHYGGPSPRNAQSHGPSYNFPPGDSVANFHLYAVEWTKSAIRWFVDDHLYETQTAWWRRFRRQPRRLDRLSGRGSGRLRPRLPRRSARWNKATTIVSPRRGR
jgi:beta-glucanase (GH16 family)